MNHLASKNRDGPIALKLMMNSLKVNRYESDKHVYEAEKHIRGSHGFAFESTASFD